MKWDRNIALPRSLVNLPFIFFYFAFVIFAIGINILMRRFNYKFVLGCNLTLVVTNYNGRICMNMNWNEMHCTFFFIEFQDKRIKRNTPRPRDQNEAKKHTHRIFQKLIFWMGKCARPIFWWFFFFFLFFQFFCCAFHETESDQFQKNNNANGALAVQ